MIERALFVLVSALALTNWYGYRALVRRFDALERERQRQAVEAAIRREATAPERRIFRGHEHNRPYAQN